MKTKNILMSILLVMGSIAAKAAGYPPELALVSQPVMVYNYNSITVYYDVENIGDYTYRGNVYIYLDPDYGYYYAEKYVRVRPGSIKRIAVDIPCHTIDGRIPYTIMPYYSMGDELYSFTTFEYFEPIRFCWHGPRTEPWVVIHIGPCPRYYSRPGSYRYYYDGFRPPMPPPGHGPGMPPPMDPMHHTYGYHYNNGGYPANHNEWTEPKPNNHEPAPSATVRPKADGGSMSSGNYNNGTSTGSANNGNNPPAPNSGSSSNSRPKVNNGGSSSGRIGNGGTSTRPNINSGTGSGTNSRPSNSGSSSGRVNNSNSNSRPSGTNNNAGTRTGNSSSNSRVNNSSSNSRPSGTSSSGSGSSSTRSSSNSSNTRSGSGSGRR